MISQNNSQDLSSTSGIHGVQNNDSFFVRISNEMKNKNIEKKKLIEILNDYLVSTAKKGGTKLDAAYVLKTDLSAQKVDKSDAKIKQLKTDLCDILSGIIAKEEAEPKILQKIKEHNEFKDLQQKDLWRLFIDHRQDIRGEYGFENESGYLSAMYKAFGRVLTTRHEKLSTDDLIRLHTDAVMGVKKDITVLNPRDSLFKKGFRDPKDRVAFDLILGKNATQKGLEELLQRMKNPAEPQMFEIHWKNANGGQPQRDGNGNFISDAQGIVAQIVVLKSTNPFRLRDYSDNLIAEYYTRIAHAQNVDQKLAAIADLCGRLERAHPFYDGNARTLGVLVINKLLLENNLPPTILYDPNMIDAFSVEELVAEIKKGQEYFASLKDLQTTTAPQTPDANIWSDISDKKQTSNIKGEGESAGSNGVGGEGEKHKGSGEPAVGHRYTLEEYEEILPADQDTRDFSNRDVKEGLSEFGGLKGGSSADGGRGNKNSPDLKDYITRLFGDFSNQVRSNSRDQQLILNLDKYLNEDIVFSTNKKKIHVAKKLLLEISKKKFQATETNKIQLQKELEAILSGIIINEQAEPHFQKVLRKHAEFKDLKQENSWQLFIDKAKNWRGKYGFENEPGYMGGMYKAFEHVLTTRNEKLSTDYLIRLHDAAVTHVNSRLPYIGNINEDLSFPKGLRDPNEPVGFKLKIGGNTTNAGVEERLKLINDPNEPKIFSIVWLSYDPVSHQPLRDSNGFFLTDSDGIVGELSTLPNSDPLWLRKYADTVIGKYHTRISQAKNVYEKLTAIADLCARLETAHIFQDGNARTIGMLLLNKLLLDNNLPPTILQDPNMIDGFSVEELVAEIKKGQDYFSSLKESESLPHSQEGDTHHSDLNKKPKPPSEEKSDTTKQQEKDPNKMPDSGPRVSDWDIFLGDGASGGKVHSYGHQKFNVGKNGAISLGMTGLGLMGSFSSLKRGDHFDVGMGFAETGSGVFGFSSSMVASSQKIGAALPKLAKFATMSSRWVPFVGSVFSVYAAGQDIQGIYQAIEDNNTRDIVKNAVGLVIDIAMAITDLIPGVGSLASIGLAVLRMCSDGIIDAFTDPHAVLNTLRLMESTEVAWYEKALLAPAFVAQALLTPDVFLSRHAIELEEQAKAQNGELNPSQDVRKIFLTQDQTVGSRVMRDVDFTAGVGSPLAGSLDVYIGGDGAKTVGITAKNVTHGYATLGTSRADLVRVFMAANPNYTYTYENKTANHYESFDYSVNGDVNTAYKPVGITKEIVTSVSAKTDAKSLTSIYKGPETTATDVIFIAPSQVTWNPNSSIPKPTNMPDLAAYHLIMKGGGRF